MRFLKTLVFIFLTSNVFYNYGYGEVLENEERAKLIPKQKKFASRSYKEIQLGYSLITDNFDLDLNGAKGNLRAQLQGLNLIYTNYIPSKNIKFIYSYGLGVSFGIAKGKASPFGEEAKNKTWYTALFLPGIDYRNDYRTRLGLFIPVVYRVLDFGFDENLKVQKNDPFSFGIGARYVNSISIKSSFSFSVSHQIIWASTSWDLNWQYRLGL